MDDYLSKPIKMLDLQKMISKWLPKNSFSVMKPLNMGDKITSNDPEFCSEKLEDDFINTTRYLNLVGNDPDRQFDFMGKYVHESKAYTDDLRKSILNKSNADIAYQSYLIKTSAKAIGFDKLEELACQIEEICLSGADMHDCNVVSEVERCLQHIDNQIDRLSNNNQINQNDV
jgi:HPt (histidine-containing phosphotransfer) domain-containing protein